MDIEVAALMADVSTSYLVNASKLRQQEQLSEQLQEALESRVVIEQAKGITAHQHSFTVDQAYQYMRPSRTQQQRQPAESSRGDRCRWASGLNTAKNHSVRHGTCRVCRAPLTPTRAGCDHRSPIDSHMPNALTSSPIGQLVRGSSDLRRCEPGRRPDIGTAVARRSLRA